MKRNKQLLLWSSLGTVALLCWAAYLEHFDMEWRRTQREYLRRIPAERAAEFSVQLRQVVVPQLKIADRCVSCHIGMAPGEAAVEGDRTFGSHPNVVHDPAQFGCTVCHGGQGRATQKEDAHGTVHFWPEPMIPRRNAYAGCGSCHTHLAVPDLAKLQRGRDLLERHDCLNCHSLEGRGGTLRPGRMSAQPAPDLSRAGTGASRERWHDHHLQAAGKDQTGEWQSSFRPLPEADLAAVNVFLASRMGAPGLVESKALFHSLGCRGCHAINGIGGDDGPELGNTGMKDPGQLDFSRVPGERSVAAWLEEHFRAPSALVPGSLMPAMGLPEESVRMLTFYMQSLRRTSFPGDYWPRDRVRAEHLGEREFAVDGATLYRSFCSSCHGASGEGMRYPQMPPFPAIGNRDFLELASDEFITATIQKGRPGRRMPAWGEKEGGLRAEEISKVVRYIRELKGGIVAVAEPAYHAAGSAEEGSRLYAQSCARCHGDEGRGGEGTALSNPVFLSTASDYYIAETVRRGRSGTSMPGFGTPAASHRTLGGRDIENIVTFIRTWEGKQ